MTTLSRGEAQLLLGAPPEEIASDLREFAAAGQVLSSDHPRLIDTYPMEWIGIFEGHVAATSPDFDTLIKKLEASGIPREKAIIRFIDKEEKTLLL